MKIKYYTSFILLVLIFLSGCSRNIPTLEERLNNIKNITPQNYKTQTINTSTYKFFTISNIKNTCENINIYFEGDGLAWITRSKISSNPTPLNPIAFKLMLTDISNCSIYIARVCQYTKDSLCSKKDWTSYRFSEKIINASNEVLENIKTNTKNKTFNLIGFSGGAAIATILSANRSDVKTLITIAGNLNTSLWTNYHNISPLKGLNPINYTNKLQGIKQYHLIGSEDRVIPKEILDSFIAKFKDKSKIFTITTKARHNCCYEESFKKLIN